jgi:coenzyme PQQ synthesis protein D (PqqD)
MQMGTVLSQEITGIRAVDGAQTINNDTIPVRSPHACIREEAEDGSVYLLYHDGLETPYLINQIARTILELCDGQRSFAQIVQHLFENYNVPGEVDLEAVASQYLLVLARIHMITF